MPFLPNNPNALNAAAEDVDQTELDSVHLDIVLAAARGDGVLAGCAVTAQGSPDMTVAVASGTAQIGGAAVTVTSGNLTIGANAATWPRYDLIVVNSSGVKSVESGAAYANASNQVFPPIPANSVAFAAVRVIPSATTITGGKITDLRAFVRTSPVLNVKDFGATGDGTTDDTVAIQACIDAAISAGAYASVTRNGLATVFFPPGTYRVNTPLRVRSVQDFSMRGSGNASKLRAGAAAMECILDLNGVAYCDFRDIAFEGSSGNSAVRAVWLRWTGTFRSTCFNYFENLMVRNLLYTRAGFELGDIANAGVQVDTDTWINCHVNGEFVVGSGNTTQYQAGFLAGDGTSANNLLHHFYGCTSVFNRYGVYNSASQVAWFGGQIGSNDVDFYCPSEGYTVVKGVRSEGSQRLLATGGSGATYPGYFSLEDITWQANAIHADHRFIDVAIPGGLRVVAVKVPYLAAVSPKIRMDIAADGALLIDGLSTSTALSSLVVKAGAGALHTVVNGYSQVDATGAITSTKVAVGGGLEAYSGDLATSHGVYATAKRATFSNANYTMAPEDRYVAQVGTMTAPRTLTLPAPASVPLGTEIILADESGTVTSVNLIIVAGDIGGGWFYMIFPNGVARLVSNGALWTRDQTFVPRSAINASATPTLDVFNVANTSGQKVSRLYVSDANYEFYLGGEDASGSARLKLRADTAGVYFDRKDGTGDWEIYRANVLASSLYVRDSVNGRMHATFSAGASSAAAVTELASEAKILGPLNHDGTTVGFYGATPVTQPAANADTSGAALADLETEVNQLKALLRSLGLMAP